MDCSCEVDLDVSDFVREIEDCFIREADKNYICKECKCEINKDDKYSYGNYEFDGGEFEYHMCLDCLSLRYNFFTNYYFGTIWEDFREHVFYGDSVSESCISKLTSKAREKVCEIIEDYWNKK